MPSPDNLPNQLPEGWVNQLKDAVKVDTRKTLLFTVVGSSVVAAFVTAGANFFLEVLKLQNNAAIENYKICLDRAKEDAKERRALYATLAEKFSRFEADFDSCVATCDDAADLKSKGRQTPAQAYEALSRVVQDLVELAAQERVQGLSVAVVEKLHANNDTTIKMVAGVMDNDRNVAKIMALPNFVNLAKAHQPEIVRTKQLIDAEMRSVGAVPCATP